MKRTSHRGSLLGSCIAAFCLLAQATQAATIVVGTGDYLSHLVLESAALGSRVYEIHYDSSSGSHDAKFLFDQALAADTTLTATFSNWGSASAPNYFINSINGEFGSSTAPWTWWKQWVSGGFGYENTNYTFNSGTPPLGTWTSGYGISAPNRTISNGSWDAFVLTDGSLLPSITPIPETSSLWLISLGTLTLVRRRRTH